MAKVAIDCDGVLADFNASFTELVIKMFPNKGIAPDFVPTDYKYNDLLTREEMTKVWNRIRATPNWWLGLNGYSDNVGFLARWLISRVNHSVYIVTSRITTSGMSVERQTEWWIKACGLTPVHNYFGILVAPSADHKVEIYRSAGFDVSIDDKAETVEQCDALPDHKAYLLDRPWNQEAKVKRRVKTMDAFLVEVR